jgi:ABC-2 type transport system ATP-binding protein
MSSPTELMTTAGPAPAVALRAVTKTFRARGGAPVHAVTGVDLTIRPGEVVSVLGPNGAGKTTTLDVLLGLTAPTTGSATVFGRPPRRAVTAGRVSAVLQSGGLLRDLTVRETVTMVASTFAEARPVDEVLDRAGITGLARRRVSKCSGGEQQRLRFALALLPDPALILLDEPTTGMDVEGRRAFWSAIRADAEKGRTVLFATHYLEEADQYADRIVLMRQGRIVADGTASQVKALAAGRTVRATMVHPDHHALARLDGVESVEVRGDTVLLHARDTDAVARHLLTQTDARDLEITARGIEDAFLALTGDTDDDERETR